MMLKAEDDDGYCSRSSLDSPIHIIKIETNSNSVLDFKEKESLKRKNMDHQSYVAPSFLEVMLTRDDWKKSDNRSAAVSNISGINASVQISRNKSLSENSTTCYSIERIPEKEFQPRKTIKLMPSSSQNLLLFTKQSALSGLVVSSKTNANSNPLTLHSLIKNNQNISINYNNHNAHPQQPNKRMTQSSSNQPIKLTAAEILKSKIGQQSNMSEVQKKLQTTKLTPLQKKINPGKDLNTQGSNDSFTSARTGQPYVRNSKGNVWTNRPTPYAGRHELHPVIDHDYCEFSAFNAEIQSGIILMSRETCARTDRMNMKRNKAPHQSPAVTSSSTATVSVPTVSLASSIKNGIIRNIDARMFSSQQLQQSQAVNQLPENKRKYLKRKFNGSPIEASPVPTVKNAVGRPRLAGKTEKNLTVGKKSNIYDSSDDLSSPPLTDDKNYVKIPGSFQNDFVYYATIRGRSSRKRQSETKQQQQTAMQLAAQQKNSVVNSNMKAFEWYREMANTDKAVRFGSKDSTLNDLNRPTRDETKNTKPDVANIFSCTFDVGKNLISESEVADLVMQMLPTSEGDPLFLDPVTSNSKLTSGDIACSDMDGIIDIGSIDLSTMATEFGNMLDSEQKQETLHGQQDLHVMDFPTMSSSQLLEDICENDLLMSTDIANMNAFLSDFPDDQVDICVESDGMLSSMIPGDVLGLIGPARDHKIRGAESTHSTCLTPPNSATISSSDGLSFPCDLNEFALDQLNSESGRENDVSRMTGDLSTLLTPPPSLSPSSAPPELITVNMYWNDLPGLMIDGKEYVRLVDIHKQIMPAKDTGILKKRCIMLSLEVASCSELQRDFLIRYMNAAKSKSKVIITKETALELIRFYVNPKMRTTIVTGNNSKIVSSYSREFNLEDSKVGPKVASPAVASPLLESQSDQICGKRDDRGTPEQIKRSARLLNKRFSYLDMVNKGLPVSRGASQSKSSKQDELREPVEDLQQKWLESLKRKFSQNVDEASSDYDENLSLREEDVSSRSEPTCEDITQEDDIEDDTDDIDDGSLRRFAPTDATIVDYRNYFSPTSKIDENSFHLSEESMSKHSQELSTSPPAVCDEELQLLTDVPETNIVMMECPESPEDFCISTPSIKDHAKEFPRKSERILRSSSSPVSETVILSSKNEMEGEQRSTAGTFVTFGGTRPEGRVNEPSNENQSPRLIRNKRRFVRPLMSSNSFKRHVLRMPYKEGLSVRAQQDKGRVQSIILQSRPHRHARRKFDTLKF